MRKLTIILSFFLISPCLAKPYPKTSSYYVGGKVGAGFIQIHDVSSNGVTFSENNANNFAGGIYVGYKFRPFIALELGYDTFTNYNYNANVADFVNASPLIYREIYDFDVLARWIIPLKRFFFTAASGFAVVISSYTGIGSLAEQTFTQPKAEVSIGYYITSSMSLGLAYSRIWGTGHFNPVVITNTSGQFLYFNLNTLPNIDLATINLTLDV